MSWLRRVMGGRTAEQWMEHARERERAGELGEAKLAYDRVADASDASAALREQADAASVRCCDALASARLEEAAQLRARGQHELAMEELQQALDTARSPSVKERARAAMHHQETLETVEAPEQDAELGPEERFALIASRWEPLQAEELEALGDPLADALVKLEAGEPEAALALLEALLERTESPSYLWLEVGRARLVCGKTDDGQQALRTFLSRIGPDEGGSARMAAHATLAQLAHDRGETDAAVAELEACAEALEDDPRPLLQLGSYLRQAGRAEEAVEVLELCQGLFTDGPVEWPVLLELGLAQADSGRASRAIATLEGIVELFATRGELDFPPVLATRLAELHESEGRLARAADLYSTLSRGGDADNRAHYLGEAARLLDAMDLREEADGMRERLRALVGE